MVSQELLEELNMIIKEDYKLELPSQIISEIANNLVNFFDLLAKFDFENSEDPKQKGGEAQNGNNVESKRD